jgi:hypothetical protein
MKQATATAKGCMLFSVNGAAQHLAKYPAAKLDGRTKEILRQGIQSDLKQAEDLRKDLVSGGFPQDVIDLDVEIELAKKLLKELA